MQTHWNTHLLCFLFVMLTRPLNAATDDTALQRIVWDKQPIKVQLNVGNERRIQFRTPVSVGIPASLQGALRIQTVNGTVYLLSQRPFPKTRVLARELNGGQTYLMDVVAVADDGQMPPLSVHLPIKRKPSLTAIKKHNPPGYVTLTRFASQQLYAPERLIDEVPGVHRVPLQNGMLELVPGKTIEATPLMAWRAGDLYITAVKLQNRSRRAQILDPRALNGNWLSATFQHARLLPNGTDADTTAVYLVSAQSFAASL